MRSLIAILLLVAAAIGLAMFASHVHPGGDLPPMELMADKDRADAEALKAAAEKRHTLLDKSAGAFDAVKAGALHATLVFVGKPPIQIELYPAAAPKTVALISSLIKRNFYKGIKVHRVEDGGAGPNGQPGLKLFQFGDPNSATTLPKDFQSSHIGANGAGMAVPLEVKLTHVKYSIGLARQEALDSGDSQMYINTGDNHSLDGDFCVFGMVVSGREVLPTIKLGDAIQSFTLQ